jgi:transposase-like protein
VFTAGGTKELNMDLKLNREAVNNRNDEQSVRESDHRRSKKDFSVLKRKVKNLVQRGHTATEIARKLDLNFSTVYAWVKDISQKKIKTTRKKFKQVTIKRNIEAEPKLNAERITIFSPDGYRMEVPLSCSDMVRQFFSGRHVC